MSVPGEEMKQAPTMAVPKRFPLATQPGFRSTTFASSDPTVRSPVTDAAIFNGYAELDPEDGQYWVEKRLGNVTLANAPGMAGGTGVLQNSILAFGRATYPLAIFGTNLYTYQGGVLAPIPYGGLSGHPISQGRAAQFLQIPFVNSGYPSSVWCANGSLWNTYFGGVLITLQYENISDTTVATGGVPWSLSVGLCDGCAYLDGVLYVMDRNGGIWGSNYNDITTWVGTTLIQAGGRNDAPVCLVQQLEYIVALKSTSFRCFYDAGSAAQTAGVGSNLAWVEGADGNFGCANAGSVQLIDQSLLWVTNNDKGTAQVAQMDGLQVKIVSTPAVERLLQTINMGAFSANPNSVINILYSSGIKRGGHRFYVLTVPPSATNAVPFTLAYDLDQQMWFPWSSPGLTYWSVTSVSTHAFDTAPGVFAQDVSSGNYYTTDIDQIYPTDSGTPCQVDIYTPNCDVGTRRRKTLNAIYFQNNQVSGSSMQIRKSDDDYRTWSAFRTVKLNKPRPNLTRCGTFTKRAYNIRHSAATPFRIKSADLQLDIGTN